MTEIQPNYRNNTKFNKNTDKRLKYHQNIKIPPKYRHTTNNTQYHKNTKHIPLIPPKYCKAAKLPKYHQNTKIPSNYRNTIKTPKYNKITKIQTLYIHATNT